MFDEYSLMSLTLPAGEIAARGTTGVGNGRGLPGPATCAGPCDVPTRQRHDQIVRLGMAPHHRGPSADSAVEHDPKA